MSQDRAVKLPHDVFQDAVGVARQALDQLGVAVPVSRDTLVKIDAVLQGTLSVNLQQVRERERAPSAEALKLRVL